MAQRGQWRIALDGGGCLLLGDALDDGDDIKEAEFLDRRVRLEEKGERLTDTAGSLNKRKSGVGSIPEPRLSRELRRELTPRTAALTMMTFG